MVDNNETMARGNQREKAREKNMKDAAGQVSLCYVSSSSPESFPSRSWAWRGRGAGANSSGRGEYRGRAGGEVPVRAKAVAGRGLESMKRRTRTRKEMEHVVRAGEEGDGALQARLGVYLKCGSLPGARTSLLDADGHAHARAHYGPASAPHSAQAYAHAQA